MSLTRFINKETALIGEQPIQQKPASNLELFSKSFRAIVDNNTTISRIRLMAEEKTKRSKLFEELTGEKLDPKKASNYEPFIQPFNSSMFDPTYYAINEAKAQEEHDDKYIEQYIKELKQKDPEKYKNILTIEQVEENARNRARVSKREFENASIRSKGFTSFMSSLLGGIAGVATDPVNIVSSLLPFGATKNASVLKTVLASAGANAATELATQPAIAKWQREIGEEYGFKEVVENVGFAALFGGSLAGVVKGTKPTASFVFGKLAKLKDLKPSQKTAALKLERDAHFKEANPYTKIEIEKVEPTITKKLPQKRLASSKIAGNKKHYQNIDEAVNAFNEGRPIKPENLKTSESEFNNLIKKVKINSKDTDVSKTLKQELKRFEKEEKPLLSDKELSDLLDRYKEAKKIEKTVKPKSLLQFIKESGGINVSGGELAARNLAKKQPFLVKKDRFITKKKGNRTEKIDISLDEVTRKAWEAGYFSEFTERPTINDLLNKIDNELAGKKIYSKLEIEKLEQRQYAQGIFQQIDELGIDAEEMIKTRKLPKKTKKLPKKTTLDEDVEPSFIDKVLEENNSPEFIKTQELDFETLLIEKPDLLISLDDGEYTIRELFEKFESDDFFIQQISTCAIGK